MTPFDDLFSSQESRSGQEAVVQLPLAEIDPFEHHPFQVRDDEAMEAMKESTQCTEPAGSNQFELLSEEEIEARFAFKEELRHE